LARQPVDPTVTRADLAVLAQAFESLHPGLYRYQTPAAWRARVDSLDAWFAEPRSRGETYLALARLTATLRCSHTYLNFWNQSRETKQWLLTGSDKLPFTYSLDREDRWVVLRSAVPGGGILPGDTIVAVEQRSTSALTATMLSAVRGDGDNDGKRRSLLELTDRKLHETVDALLPLVLPPTRGAYRVRVLRGGGHPAGAARDTSLAVSTITASARRTIATPLPMVRPNAELARDGEIGILRVDGFEFESGWGRFLSASFASLRQSGAEALVLDLRENEGGSDEGAVQLLRYLIRVPLALPPVRRRVAYETVSPALRPFLQTWDNDFYDRRGKVSPLGDGTYALTDRGDWPDAVRPVQSPFPGRIVVLTGPVNSSASHTLIRLLRGQPNVTLVGAPTGGSLRASTGGNLFFLRLPGSGLEVDIPLISYEWGDDQPSGGVPPDLVTPERDALRAALALLRAP
jgi:C-terminal processing protease CtpA/Prc